MQKIMLLFVSSDDFILKNIIFRFSEKFPFFPLLKTQKLKNSNK